MTRRKSILLTFWSLQRMSGYSDNSLQRKLQDLKTTAPSIQATALWLLHHSKHYKTTVRLRPLAPLPATTSR